MTVERRLAITAGILILFALGTGALLFLSSRLVGTGIRGTESASQAARSAFMMTVALERHLLHGDMATLREGDKHRESLGQTLNEMSSESIDQALLADLQKKYEAVDLLFPRIMQMAGKQEVEDQDRKAREMLTDLTLFRLSNLVNAANDLSKATYAVTLTRRHFVGYIIVVSGVLMVLIILVNIYLIRKSVIDPLKALSAGAERIGSGNFDYVAEIRRDDEVGKLALAFNTMIERLQERTAALRKAKDELEIKVQERTAELKAASAYNRSLIEASLDPLVTINAEGKITDANTAAEKVTGYSAQELIGTDFADYFTEPDKARSGYELVFQEGQVKNYELAIRHKYGWLTPIIYNASLYRDEDGQVVGVFAAARDITERKRAEDELTRSNEDLQQFAYVASHDLQEPLRNVASCLQLLEKEYKNKLDPTADQYINYSVEGAVRMKALILDLLAYSRVATKGRPPERIDSELVLDLALKNLDSAIAETGAVITHDPLPTIRGDGAQLLQVFQNLIGNAIKFRGDQPPQINVSAVKNKNQWTFSIKDNGIGIESRHLDKIFVIFQRLHKRSEYDGTGMGLAIAKKVIERHGGQIWVESEPGVGTTFHFTIPEKGQA
jgi:PAS domain S-box-containing protein